MECDILRVIATACSDMGSRKAVNQDGYFMKSGHFGKQLVCLAVLCDGMGGFDSGEKASDWVITNLDTWFSTKLQSMILQNTIEQKLDEEINIFLNKMNDQLINYGNQHDIKLGTTCSILLIVGTKLFVYHVGDTRIYQQTKNNIALLTEDQTLAARKLRNGEITIDEAKRSPERSVLLQCVGVRNDVLPYKQIGHIQVNDSFLLCSDGFYHSLSDIEIENIMMQQEIEEINCILKKSIHKIRTRGEVDDATAIVMKVTSY